LPPKKVACRRWSSIGKLCDRSISDDEFPNRIEFRTTKTLNFSPISGCCGSEDRSCFRATRGEKIARSWRLKEFLCQALRRTCEICNKSNQKCARR
jgi:hypothetical protein